MVGSDLAVVIISFRSLAGSCLPCGIWLREGRPIRGRGRMGVVAISRLGEGKILSDIAEVRVGNQCRFPKIALAFAIFALRQMAFALFAT